MRTPDKCPHEEVEPRGRLTSFAGWQVLPSGLERDEHAGLCRGCGHFVRRRYDVDTAPWVVFQAATSA